MLMNLPNLLRSSDVEIIDEIHEPKHRAATGKLSRIDAEIRIRIDDREVTLLVEVRQRAPYRGEIVALRNRARGGNGNSVSVLVAPFISEPVGRTLVDAGWSWADQSGNCDIRAKGLRLVRRITSSPERPMRRSLPGGKGGLTIVRWFITEGREPVSATKLAQIASVSQPRASQCLAELEHLGLVNRVSRSGWVPDGPGLWKAFLESYSGPKGTEQYFYSLEKPLQTALEAVRAAPSSEKIALSADVGPDVLVPYRSSTHLVIYYTGHPIRLSALWQETRNRHDANVILRIPQDTSLFSFKSDVIIWDKQLPLAHPTQLAWDLYDLGGEDRMVQADELEEWTHKYRDRL